MLRNWEAAEQGRKRDSVFQRVMYAVLCLMLGVTMVFGSHDIANAQSVAANDESWANSFLLRGRVVGVIPEDSARYNLSLLTDVSNQAIPEFDFTYFFTENFAVETICCATRHTVSLAGGPDIGEAWLVPFMAVAQYHFHLGNGVKPYLGVGPTLTFVASDSAKGPATSFDLEKWNPGVVLQAGVDIKLKDNWHLNADVKKLFVDIGARATAGAAVAGTASIDPWIAGIGIGIKF